MMNLPVFFMEDTPSGKEVVLSEETSRHAVQVLRMTVGERLHLTDGKGHLWLTRIVEDHKKKTRVLIEEHHFQAAPAHQTAIAISLIKNASRFEWFLEKATEIGITAIVPLLCERTEKQHFRFDRMKGILVSAMLQSQQVWMPELKAPVDFDTFIAEAGYEQKFIAHCEEAKKSPLKDHLRGEASSLVLIGPEGDFSKDEIDQALARQFIQVSLGDTRLRTETAGMVAATLLKLF